MRLKSWLITFLLAFTLPFSGNAFELQRAGWGYQHLFLLVDFSKNAVGCKETMRKELKALDHLLSPKSLERAGVNKISFVLFSNNVLEVKSIKAEKRLSRKKDFVDLSEKAKRSFVSLFERWEEKAKRAKKFADVYGAIELALSMLEKGERASLVIVSPGIQNLNRNLLGKLRVPENVKRVVFLAFPFECREASESFKFRAFETFVKDYWKGLLIPESKVEVLYNGGE